MKSKNKFSNLCKAFVPVPKFTKNVLFKFYQKYHPDGHSCCHKTIRITLINMYCLLKNGNDLKLY